MRKFLTFFTGVLLASMGLIHFEFLDESQADEQIVGSGATYWSIDQAIGSNSAASTQCIHRTDSLTTCAVFPAGTGDASASKATLITANGVGKCCWSMDSGLTISASTLVDAVGGNGQCAGPRIATAGYEADESPNRDALIEGACGANAFTCTGSGIRRGLCAVTTGVSRDVLNMPCDEDSDCPSGSCDLTPTADERSNAGVYLLCRGVTGTSSVTFSVRKQRIRKK